jgi:predicted DNA binding CopG/RHH family protein
VYLERVIGEKAKNCMKGEHKMSEVIYTDAPADVEEAMERGKVLDISVEDLIKRNKKERITIMIDSENLEFFRKQAETQGMPYQTMINNSLTATRFAIQKQAMR